MNDNWELATTLAAGIGTLAIFSFLIRENAFYRFFEHLFIGIAAGFLPVYGMKNTLWPRILEPMLGLNIVIYPDGTASEAYDSTLLLYIIPLAFGTLYYFIYSRRYSWLAKLVIGFSLGVSAGLAFKGFFVEMMPQIVGSFKPLLVRDSATHEWLWAESVNNIIFVFTLFSVMYYFFFSFRVQNKALGAFGSAGRWLMMICFGAFFGSTVMARMALLAERLQFLLGDWVAAILKISGKA